MSEITKETLLNAIEEYGMTIAEVYGMVLLKHFDKNSKYVTEWKQPMEGVPYYNGKVKERGRHERESKTMVD